MRGGGGGGAALALAAAAGAGGCLLCEPGAARALGALVGPYLARALPRQPELRARVAALLRSGLRGLAALPRHPATFMGVIDENTLHEASTHFRRTVGRVMEQNYQDERVFNELYWMLQEVKDHFEQLMRRFQSEAFCPNNCGRMEQVWIDCWSCNTSLFSCMRGLLCGERRLSVAEDEDLILDCGLAWHRAAHGTKTYIFYR
ncbi:izumo sperm-egg fusion protein 1 [Apteryx mantelli]|uniref:Izumo sperm-egg fusion protein 1 n=1 Tax=Apteryx mantelli TaxID=2696672 RepID=A0ABM4FZL3_9AVES